MAFGVVVIEVSGHEMTPLDRLKKRFAKMEEAKKVRKEIGNNILSLNECEAVIASKSLGIVRTARRDLKTYGLQVLTLSCWFAR